MTKAKLTAFTMKHQPTPMVVTSTAVMVGPMTRATFTVVLLSVTALRIRPRPATAWTNAWRAGLSTALNVPANIGIALLAAMVILIPGAQATHLIGA